MPVATTPTRIRSLRAVWFCRGYLTTAERQELKRLVKLERQCAKRRQRYASDPEYRRRLIARAVAWKQERRA